MIQRWYKIKIKKRHSPKRLKTYIHSKQEIPKNPDSPLIEDNEGIPIKCKFSQAKEKIELKCAQNPKKKPVHKKSKSQAVFLNHFKNNRMI